MKLIKATPVVAALLSLTSAAECPVTEVAAPAPGSKTPMETACPSLYVRGENAIDLGKPETVTAASLEALKPCKESTCLTELRKLAPEDCTVNGLNMKAYHEATVALCEAFTAGPVTVATAIAILEPVIKNATETTPSTNTSTEVVEMPSTVPNMAPIPAPTTTPKSGASSVVATGAIVFVVTTAFHWVV